jgi:hypothetical protein
MSGLLKVAGRFLSVVFGPATGNARQIILLFSEGQTFD